MQKFPPVKRQFNLAVNEVDVADSPHPNHEIIIGLLPTDVEGQLFSDPIYLYDASREKNSVLNLTFTT